MLLVYDVDSIFNPPGHLGSLNPTLSDHVQVLDVTLPCECERVLR